MKIIIKYIEKINEVMGKIHAYSIFVLMIVVFYEVIMRYVFNAPTRWAYDTSWILYSIVVLAGAFVLQKKGHVRIDIMQRYYPDKINRLLEGISYLLIIFIPMAILTYEAIRFAKIAWVKNEYLQTSAIYLIAGPIKTLIPIGFCLVTLQSLIEFYKLLKKD